MELLQTLLENARFPFVIALILGLMTAISPCPLATNITAIGYISKDLENRKRVFWNGVIYTLGRAIAYTGIGLIFFFGANKFEITRFIQKWGERSLGPLLFVIGIFMLGLIKINFLKSINIAEKLKLGNRKSFLDVLFLGIVFALAFCPYSGVLYFGMLIPLTISSAMGLYLPIVFALATGFPVLLIAWILAFSLSNVGKFYNSLKSFELWFRRVVALVFIAVGVYYFIIFYF